jgi:hypothetical protein
MKLLGIPRDAAESVESRVPWATLFAWLGCTTVMLIVAASCGVAAAQSTPTIKITQPAAGIANVAFASEELPLQTSGGGFVALDFAAGRKPLLRQGVVQSGDGSQSYHAQQDDLSLDAQFTPQADGTVRVRGLLRNADGKDRAVILRYVLPMRALGARIEHELSDGTTVEPTTQTLGTVFPLVAMASGNRCGVLAIPPRFPCCFGMTGSAEGLGVEFYLGLTPATKQFPNQATFEFLMYTADAAAPFRSALARYFALFPEYYQRRFQRSGFWDRQEKGDIGEALHLYRYEDLSMGGAEFRPNLERNRSHGVLSFGYQLVGQREMKRLPELPEDYDGLMRVYAEAARELRANPDKVGAKSWEPPVPDVIERCACTDANGHYVHQALTVAGKNSIKFIMNPNPDLFADSGLPTVGSASIAHCAEALKQYPLDGIDLDSIGGRWPATLNFRRDHIPYARYPLTFDYQGRVALHNRISHYEFMEKLRALLHAQGKYFFANGIDTYQRTPEPETPQRLGPADGERYVAVDTFHRKGAHAEHYNSCDNGRFFLAALLDTGGRENTAPLERRRLERYRTMMGPKLFTMLLYKWEDPELLRAQMNRALAYAIFAAPNDLQNVGYLTPRNGYHRDKQLLEWFVSNARLLQDAGWEPVTHARVSSTDVSCERFGSSQTVYFALLDFVDQARTCDLAIDLKALGVPAERSQSIDVREIAQGAKIESHVEEARCCVHLRLEPDRTQVIAVKLPQN